MAEHGTTASAIKPGQTVNAVAHIPADVNDAPMTAPVAAPGGAWADPSRAGARIETQSIAQPLEPTLTAAPEAQFGRLAEQPESPPLDVTSPSHAEMPGALRTYVPVQAVLRSPATGAEQPTPEARPGLKAESDTAPAPDSRATPVENQSRSEPPGRTETPAQQTSPRDRQGASGDPPAGERAENNSYPRLSADAPTSPRPTHAPAALAESPVSNAVPAGERMAGPVLDKPQPPPVAAAGSENTQSRTAAVPAASDAVERTLVQDASVRTPERHSSSQPLPTGTRNESSATQAIASHADLADQPQDPGLGRANQPHAAEAQPEPEPKSQPQLQPDRPPQAQPQLQVESQQLTPEAHSAREIARPDAGPIAPNIEGHAPREAAHLSSPQIPTQVEIVEQIARAARAELHSGRTELTLRLDPPTLGSVNMRVVSQGAAVTAHLEASAEASRDLINANLPALKEALAGVGIDISHFSVTVGGGERQDMANGLPAHPHGTATGATTPHQEAREPDAAAIAALRAWAGVGGRYFDAFA
jgi:flagellar hook-length control protein FliK